MNISNRKFYNKVVLLRVDFNVPIKNGIIQDMTRIIRVMTTIKYLVNSGAKVVIISHLGRPQGRDNNLSLKNIVKDLSELLKQKVKFVDDCIGKKVQEAVSIMSIGDVILLENLRFYKEEEENDLDFAEKLSSIADLYVNDAFSCSHRAHASISCITEFLPSYEGLCLQDELKYLEKAISFQAKPITAIVGGSKISTKINMLERLAEKVDFLVLGGAIANNFLLFNKINIGKSLFLNGANDILYNIIKIANHNNCRIIIPEDVLVTLDYKKYNTCILREVSSIQNDDTILDIGPNTLKKINNVIKQSKTIIWNGPIGVFEHSPFAGGTIELMTIISTLTKEGKLTSVIGGGDSLSAINVAGLNTEDFTYVSTGGGAFLSWLSGDNMPGIPHKLNVF